MPVKTATSIPFSDIHPDRIWIDGLPVDPFPTLESFFERVVYEATQPEQRLFFNVNVHAANLAYRLPRYKNLLLNAHAVFCDGAGIVLASKILPGQPIPGRYTAADYLPELLKKLAEEGLTAYFLCGEPGVADQAMAILSRQVPNHTVVGWHHGFILKDAELEKRVLHKINDLNPDILFVGFGMPLQEYWLEEHRHELNVKLLFPLGATLDYLSKKVPRCPAWMGNTGLEWLFRLGLEPKRMFERYVLGNPAFLMRVAMASIRQRLLPKK
jgi:N-acetylglucosaminyldiphosphoundecaprenol N-acetyl-beta-D-mannosaminyltransferase